MPVKWTESVPICSTRLPAAYRGACGAPEPHNFIIVLPPTRLPGRADNDTLAIQKRRDLQMKAVHIHNYGGRDVLHYDDDAQRPSPGPGEVLIRVHATTVNPFDCWVHNGWVANMFNYTFPLIPGTDASGVIEELGEGVTDVAVGDEVYTRAGIFRNGTNAEYVVTFAADVAPKPNCLDHVQAAALPHVTLTAYAALFELADLQPGQTILIHAAAGGVGHIAVQLAKLHGANVIGTASVNIPTLKKLGVDEAVDYSTTNF